jgi:hypothetical protein
MVRCWVWFLLLLSLVPRSGASSPPPTQIQALYALYNSTNGPFWNWKNESLFGPRWNFTSSHVADPCSDKKNHTWQGITCSSSPALCEDQDCAILSVSLESYNLFGTIPLAFLSLEHLTSLVLSSNCLTGTLPPLFFTAFSALISFDLSSNYLTGSVPDLSSSSSSPPALVSFSLSGNQFTGTFPLSLCSATHLSQLSLARNHLTGPLPSSLSQLTQLISFNVAFNRLSRPILSEFGSLTSLSVLFLFCNQFSGQILPSSVSCLSFWLSLFITINSLVLFLLN